jgi:hypothetical protein
MPTFAPTSQKTQRELLAEGTYPARIYEYIHLGTQKGEWEGRETNYYKIRFTFEFPTEKRTFTEEKGEQPMVMSFDATLSFNEKANLRKIAEACYGKITDAEAVNFDVDTLIGKACLVSVAHKPPKDGIVYSYISGFMPLMKGLSVEDQINPSKVLTFENWSEEVFATLPKFVQEKITSSKEYKYMKNPAPIGKGYEGDLSTVSDYNGEVNVDDIPF